MRISDWSSDVCSSDLLYGFSLFDLGLPLVAFFTALMLMGWGMGMVIVALVLRYGLGAESLAWVALFAFAPISCVYYPVSTLPDAVQWLAWATPSAYVFEGMRAVMVHKSEEHTSELQSLMRS